MTGTAVPRLLERLPLAYVVIAPLAWFVALVVAREPYLEVVRFGIYIPYAAATLVIAAGSIILVNRSRTGKVALWLVALTYEAVFFALAIAGILALTTVRTINPGLIDPNVTASASAVWLQALSYAMIAGSASATVLTAVVLVYGLRNGGLFLEIDPLPRLRRKKRTDKA